MFISMVDKVSSDHISVRYKLLMFISMVDKVSSDDISVRYKLLMFISMVDKVSSDHINVKFLTYAGTVHRIHLKQLPDKYEVQQQVGC